MEQATHTVNSETETDLAGMLPTDLTVVEDCLHQLRLAAQRHPDDTDTPKAACAVDLTVTLKRAEAFLEAARIKLRGVANSEFTKLQADNPNKKQWAVCGGLGVLKSTTPRANWKYPLFVEKLEMDLRVQKKTAQENGTATKAIPTVDPQSSTMFTVTLSDSFGV
jgi:hypothetical protein